MRAAKVSRWRAEFDTDVIEQQYRRHSVRDWRRNNLTGIVVIAAFMVLVAISDLLLHGWAEPIITMMVIRLAMLSALAVICTIVWRTEDPRRGDWAILTGVLLTAVFLAVITALRPIDQPRLDPLTYQMLGVGFIIAAYLVFSMRFVMSLAAGIAATVGYNAGSYLSPYLPTPDAISSIGLQIIGNVLLALLVYRLNVLRRVQFGQYISERTAREDLARRELDLLAASKSLEQARDRAVEATKAKSDFLANISHEIRTPLNAIIGFSDVMRQRARGPADFGPYAEYIDDISVSADHLLSVINDLLDLSRVEAGKFELDEEVFSLSDLVSSAIILVAERAEREHVTLSTGDLPDDVRLKGDLRVLRQVIVNLLTNAIKYNKSGGRVGLRGRIDKDGGFALAITDTGPGIPADELSGIMELYGRADRARRQRVDGTGLGLPMARMHMELHDGMLTLESEEGVGTTATMQLPASRVVPGTS